MPSSKPFHIVFEGIDGCGKGTQVRRLCEWLVSKGRAPHVVTDPGASGAGAAPAIRQILLDKNVPMTPEQQLLLYTAARINARDCTARLLAAGCDVVGDRFLMSTIVYQGMVYNNSLQHVKMLHECFVKMQPDCTILLDIPALAARKRLEQATPRQDSPPPDQDRHESQGLEFANKLVHAYRLAAEDDPRAWIVDADQPEELVFQAVLHGIALKVPGFSELC
jgi:dTMP kinase